MILFLIYLIGLLSLSVAMVFSLWLARKFNIWYDNRNSKNFEEIDTGIRLIRMMYKKK